MSEPSDPTGAGPINRLDQSFGSFEVVVGNAMEATWFKDEDRPLSSQILNLEEYSTVWKQLDERELYRAVYTLTRTSLALGETLAEIRVGFVKMAEERPAMLDTILMAMEDAFADRPPRW